MADLKVKINIKYAEMYAGKQPQLFKKIFDLPSFDYDKTVKIEDGGLTFKELEKEFEQAAHGIFATITYVIDEILKENKISAKDNLMPSVIKSVQAQLLKELKPYNRSLTKLLEATIDELGGNEVADTSDPNDTKAVEKYLATLKKLDDVNPGFVNLDKQLRAAGARAAGLINSRHPPPPTDPKQDAAWLSLIDEVEQANAAFAGVVKGLQKALKAHAPALPPQKAPSKESKEAKEQREALNELVEQLKQVAKRLEPIQALIADVTTLGTTLVAGLKTGRKEFRMAKWPELPDTAQAWNKLETTLDAAEKQLKLVEKLAK